MARDWALFLHLLGPLVFVGASAAVTALRLLAIGTARQSESALLLRAARPLVPLVGLENDHGPPPGTRDRPSDTDIAARLAARPADVIMRHRADVVQSARSAAGGGFRGRDPRLRIPASRQITNC